MPGARKTREDDEQLLRMLERRCLGEEAGQIGKDYGMIPNAVRVMTNRVFNTIRETEGRA